MTDARRKVTLVSRKDLDISYFCGSGAGGQKRNKTASGVQIIHRASGAIGRASDTRSQDQNKQAAFKRMYTSGKFKLWLNRRLYELEQEETLEETIEKETQPKYLKYEIQNEQGQWIQVQPEYFETSVAKQENS